MTKCPSYDPVMPHKYAGIKVDTSAAFHNIMLVANAIRKAQESQATSTELVEDEKKAMKS